MSENSNESPDTSAPQPNNDASSVAPKAPDSGKPTAPKIDLNAGQSKPPIKTGSKTNPPTPPTTGKPVTPVTKAETTRKPLNVTKPPVGAKEATKFTATKSPFVASKPGNTKFSVTQSPFAPKGKAVGIEKTSAFPEGTTQAKANAPAPAPAPVAAGESSGSNNTLLIALGAIVAIGSIAVAAIMYKEVAPYL